MKATRKKLSIAAFLMAFIGMVGTFWFLFFGGAYEVELWVGRFDRTIWVENKTEGRYSPRRPMVKAVMRKLSPGMTREQVEAVLGFPNYEKRGWQAYVIGYPRWEGFALDYDVFEIRYEKELLVEMRVRST